jgi:hypothetical protein
MSLITILIDIYDNSIVGIAVLIITCSVGYFLGLIYQKRIQTPDIKSNTTEDNSVIRLRLMNVRNHTMRLKELYSLRKRVSEFDRESESIDKSIHRLEMILDKLHKIIDEGDVILAESLLTRFSKHLRQLLHECASNTIDASINVEHIDCILALLSSLNYNRWAYEIDTDGLADIDLGRGVKSMITSSWIFEKLWDLVTTEQIENGVKLEISSDTFTVKYKLETNGNSYFLETKLI